MIRRIFLSIGLVAALLGAPASVLAQDAAPVISAQDDQFVPAMTTLTAGTPLTWQNDGIEEHTITADDNAYDSGSLDPGQTFALTFDTPGTYAYYCSIHGGPGGQGMAGIIVVS
jgi:plastocyanin